MYIYGICIIEHYIMMHYIMHISSTDKDCRITVESEQQFSRQSKISHFPLIFAKIRKYNNWVTNLMSGDSAELGTRQLYSLATTTTRQRNRASVIRKIQKMLRSWRRSTIFWPENMVMLSRQYMLSHAQLCTYV